MANLPLARLATFCRPFSYVGIDYFGPMYVTVGRRTEKRWGALFTCLTIRAIHLEVAHTLNASSCIMCIKNFIARRGIPIQFISDNGTNFHAASKELACAINGIDNSKIIKCCSERGIQWKFNPPSAPHFGGSWERLVRSVKISMYALMPRRNPTDEILKNLFAEVELIVNSRPLTYLPVEEHKEALTPNHFLLGSSSGIKPSSALKNDNVTVINNWKTTQHLADQFWLKEYLPNLTKKTKWFEPTNPVKVGDVVIIVDKNAPRHTWLKGIIKETLASRSEHVRQAVDLWYRHQLSFYHDL